jgi:hypothetical protein
MVKRRPLEKGVQKTVVEHARKTYGLLAVKHSGGMGGASHPDYEFYLPGGRPLLIEFKRPGEFPTPLQEERIKRLRALGYDVQVIDSTADGKRLIDDCMGGLRSGAAKVDSAAAASCSLEASASKRLCSVVGRSGLRKNSVRVRGVQDSQKREAGKKNAGHRATAALLPGVAQRTAEMERLLGLEGGRPAWH